MRFLDRHKLVATWLFWAVFLCSGLITYAQSSADTTQSNAALKDIYILESSVNTTTFPSMNYFEEKLDLFNKNSDYKIIMAFLPPQRRNIEEVVQEFRTANNIPNKAVTVIFMGNPETFVPDTTLMSFYKSQLGISLSNLITGEGVCIYWAEGDLAAKVEWEAYAAWRTKLLFAMVDEDYNYIKREKIALGQPNPSGERALTPLLDGMTDLCIRVLTGECLPKTLKPYVGKFVQDHAGFLTLEEAKKLEAKIIELSGNYREDIFVRTSDGLVNLTEFTYYDDYEETTYTLPGIHFHFSFNCQAMLPSDEAVADGSHLLDLTEPQMVVFNKNMRSGRYYEAINRYIDWQMTLYNRAWVKSLWYLLATFAVGALMTVLCGVRDLSDKLSIVPFMAAFVCSGLACWNVYEAAIGFWQVGFYLVAMVVILLGPVVVILIRGPKYKAPVDKSLS
ncbi:MAG: TPM domain-containing protein [Cytophagales bacterium]|nr:MAG: TPM domain-containing protein [Cytophagales bacterium]TAF59394.1 MAG: TPM domain-containing protein [Cytophagales bacterium]